MFEFSKKNRESFLKRMGSDFKIKKPNGDWKPIRAILERKLIETDEAVSTTTYITANASEAAQDDLIKIGDEVFEVAYVVDDLSGLADFYLSLKSATGRKSKYE